MIHSFVARPIACVNLLVTKLLKCLFASIAIYLPTFFCAEYLQFQNPVEELHVIAIKDLTKEGKLL